RRGRAAGDAHRPRDGARRRPARGRPRPRRPPDARRRAPPPRRLRDRERRRPRPPPRAGRGALPRADGVAETAGARKRARQRTVASVPFAHPAPLPMKVIALDAFGGPDVLALRDVEQPTPGPGEVLVRVHATSVNPVDTKVRRQGS